MADQIRRDDGIQRVEIVRVVGRTILAHDRFVLFSRPVDISFGLEFVTEFTYEYELLLI